MKKISSALSIVAVLVSSQSDCFANTDCSEKIAALASIYLGEVTLQEKSLNSVPYLEGEKFDTTTSVRTLVNVFDHKVDVTKTDGYYIGSRVEKHTKDGIFYIETDIELNADCSLKSVQHPLAFSSLNFDGSAASRISWLYSGMSVKTQKDCDVIEGEKNWHTADLGHQTIQTLMKRTCRLFY